MANRNYLFQVTYMQCILPGVVVEAQESTQKDCWPSGRMSCLALRNVLMQKLYNRPCITSQIQVFKEMNKGSESEKEVTPERLHKGRYRNIRDIARAKASVY